VLFDLPGAASGPIDQGCRHRSRDDVQLCSTDSRQLDNVVEEDAADSASGSAP
jgi:hypothetical protein